MSEYRRALLNGPRNGVIVLPIIFGMLIARPMWAQLLGDGPVSGLMTVTQPLTDGTRGDVAGYVVVDPSAHTLAPWASVGVRWGGLLALEAHPIANLGVRFHRRSLRVAFGISRDVAYGSLGRSEGTRTTPSTPSPNPDTLGGSGPIGIADPGPLASSADSARAAARTAYAMQAITDLVSAMDWDAGPIVINAMTGWRLAGPAKGRPWYSATAALPLPPIRSLALVGGLDRRYDQVSPGKVRLTLGLQWRAAPWARRSVHKPSPSENAAPVEQARRVPECDVAVRRLANGIRIVWPSTTAAHVEARSDITGWVAVPFRPNPDGAGEWQLDLVATPGIHRLSMRVDGGAWMPPPGLPVGSDGYGAAVGILIVEP